MRGWSITLPVLLLVISAVAAGKDAGTLTLPDGRAVPFLERRKVKGDVVLTTVFGELRFPAAVLDQPAEEQVPPPRPGELRKTESKWFSLETDLTEERAAEHRDTLDAYFEWMLSVYRLDPVRIREKAPYRIVVYGSRAEFRRAQAKHVDEVSRLKGNGFGEGLAGFFSSGDMTIYLWDCDAARRGHLEVAKHETTHLLNHLLAREHSLRIPVWFQEGTAVYFSAAQGTVGKEPGDLSAALAMVAGEVRANRAMGNRELRSTPYGRFLGREYAWGWGLIRFVRRHRGGAGWEPLLDHLRTISGGAPSDSENGRFLETLGFATDEKLDATWRKHLLDAAGKRGRTPLGATPEALAAVEALKKPTRVQARDFVRVGMSFLTIDEPGPAVVYLRAALRGGVDGPDVFLALAEALARKEGLTIGEPWPPESVDLLARAVDAAPLEAGPRWRLGEQLLLTATDAAGAAAARDALGLAFLTMGPDDDRVGIVISLLSASHRAGSPLTEEDLARLRPDSRDAVHAALPYHLQEEERWGELTKLLEARVEAGEARRWEREMFAGLLRAAGRSAEAARGYQALLDEDGTEVHLWLPLIQSLIEARELRAASIARTAALQALDRRARGTGVIRRRIEKLEIR